LPTLATPTNRSTSRMISLNTSGGHINERNGLGTVRAGTTLYAYTASAYPPPACPVFRRIDGVEADLIGDEPQEAAGLGGVGAVGVADPLDPGHSPGRDLVMVL
jgi:hypothetical protein